MQETGFDDAIYLAHEDIPEFGIERGDHVVITGFGEPFPMRVVKLHDRESFVRVMSAGALDRMTLLPVPNGPPTFSPPSLSRRPRRARSARPK